MRFFPFEKLLLTTQLPEQAVKDRLMAATGDASYNWYGKRRLPDEIAGNSLPVFMGTVSDGGLKLQKITKYRKDAGPLVSGSFKGNGWGTKILLRIRMEIPEIVFLFIWIGCCLYAMVSVITEGLAKNELSPGSVLFPIIAGGIGYVLLVARYMREHNFCKQYLTTLLEAQPTQTG